MSEGKKEILLGDCLELMKDIPNGSIDMILCDLPYGTTACKWDVIIPFDKLYEIIKQAIEGAIETMQGLCEITIPGESKKFEASLALSGYAEVNDIQADTAIQLAVYAVKS